jgi:hypothetical protein
MMYFKKLFKFPGPKDLGMSDNNYAMPSRLFPNNQTEVSWEDYYEHLAQAYPVKFFLASTVPDFFVRVWWKVSRPFKDFHYWIVSHLVPSRRYHFLDLRQSDYRYGWLEADMQMEHALFNIFKNYVELQHVHSSWVPSEEEAAKDDGVDYNYAGFKRQLADHKEIMAIYHWITQERQIEIKEHDDKLTEWSDARHAWADNAEQLFQELRALDDRNQQKLNDMLQRILRIRRSLWT